jgi:curved DNA-binding protein CbpA
MPEPFIDYYDLLQVSSNADGETISRVFRLLARRCHPHSKGGGDRVRFDRLVEAHTVLSDPITRAAYDVKYQENWDRQWSLASQASEAGAFEADKETRGHLLALLYAQRRRSMGAPGLGEYELARLLQLPMEVVEFHLWYLKEKGWIQRIDTGQMAISASGVDSIERSRLRIPQERLLAARANIPVEAAGGDAGAHTERVEGATDSPPAGIRSAA